ncbi:MAG TPA: RagB/SusD family nutrient uptake outer membrane protein [Cyclobacteriaceae bacterium]|nr:RagB/SusD family nutrient uptake outer membrane protein [Cyclobacteriaceae bacterium]
MNRTTKYIACLALVFVSVSCKEEFLEIVPQDALAIDGFFRSADEIRRVTGAVYGSAWFDANDKFLWCAGDGMAGDLLQDYADEGQLFFLSFTENNAVILQGWRGLYRVIAGANSVINDMPPIAESYGVSEEAINAGIAEGRFLRGTAYFFLAEFWGDVPVVENGSEVVKSGNLQLPKNTRRSVYEFIRKDLEYAAANLPAQDAPGRVTKWSAQGMLAKLHLTMASELNDANSVANFAKAKEYAGNVIQQSSLSLMPKYEDLFKVENNNNPESLFAIQFTAGAYGIGNSHQAVLARNTMLTGISEGWGGYKSLTVDFINNLVENSKNGLGQPQPDLRRKSIYMTLGDHYPEIHKAQGGYTYNIHKKYPEDYPDVAFAGQTETAAPVLNNVKKYVLGNAEDVGVSVSNQATPINQYILRLADVYLIYAEATIGAGNETSDGMALSYYNAIRTRAGLSTKTAITYADVFNERRVEFGMEGINWFDVKRRFYRENHTIGSWFLVNGELRNVRYQLIDNGADDLERNMVESYRLQPPTTPVVPTVEKMFLPIPSQEVIANPMLAPTVEPVNFVSEN